MNVAKERILIVDDSPTDIQLLIENLTEHFEIAVSKDGPRALELAEKDPKPNAILLDVSMPGMDGYTVCSHLKENPETAEIDVIFVSANDSIEEKVKGYKVGASDYLTKPVDTTELLKKVTIAVNNNKKRQSSLEQQQNAINVARSAISDVSEQAIVVSFLKKSYRITDFAKLAQSIVDATRLFDLSNSVQIRTPERVINASSTGPVPPLEEELMFRLSNCGRINHRGARLILNFGPISQLVKNMPLDDEAKCGRIRDHLALILEGAESKCDTLILDQKLQNLMRESQQSLSHIQTIQSKQKEKFIQIVDDMKDTIKESFLTYGLTEEQENLTLDVVDRAIDQTLDNFEAGLELDKRMQQILDTLGEFVTVNESQDDEDDIDDDVLVFF